MIHLGPRVQESAPCATGRSSPRRQVGSEMACGSGIRVGARGGGGPWAREGRFAAGLEAGSLSLGQRSLCLRLRIDRYDGAVNPHFLFLRIG